MHAWIQLKEECIIKNINHFVLVLDAIIKAEGTYVPDHKLHSGHRWVIQIMVLGWAVGCSNRVTMAKCVQRRLIELMEL